MEISEQQRKELEEKLSKMSPEEIRQLQQQQCIFCKIANGEIPSKTVYEDDRVRAVLDINPASPGHCIIIPKDHVLILPQMPDEKVRHMFCIAKQLSHTQLRALKVEGTTWMVANGAVAGQRAQHVMLHLIPRKENDGVGVFLPAQEPNQEINAELTQKLQQMFSGNKSAASPASGPGSSSSGLKPPAAENKTPSLPPPETIPEHDKPVPVEPEEATKEKETPQREEPDKEETKETPIVAEPKETAVEPESEPEESPITTEPPEEEEETPPEEMEEESEEEEDQEEESKKSSSKKSSLDDITRFLSGQ